MKIHQVSVAGSVIFFKKGFIDRWNLMERYDIDLPCFFLGIEQTDKINEHRGIKIIYPISPWDCTFLEKVDRKDNIILINSPFLPNNHGYKTKNVEIELKKYDSFQPKTLGDKIYTYIGWESRKTEFKFELLREIQSKIPWEIIYFINDEYASIDHIIKNYYDKVFLNINLSHGTGMTTVRELGMMGVKTIMNCGYDFPSIIKYKDQDDIIRIINEESKKIGTTQDRIDCHNVGDEWMDLDFWL